MAKYELNIYGKNDEIVKNYETNIVPWGIFIKAAKLKETMTAKSEIEQIESVNEILKEVFVGLKNDELMHADAYDVMNTFEQIVSGGQKINGGSKNG